MSVNGKSSIHLDVMGNIIAFENGDLEHEDVLALFQELVNSGLAWSLQGSYGRTAAALIEAGEIETRIHTCARCGHAGEDHSGFGVYQPCNHKDYVDGTHCVCYAYVELSANTLCLTGRAS
jgi:hypothetical protein